MEISQEILQDVGQSLVHFHIHVRTLAAIALETDPTLDRFKTMAIIRDQLMASRLGQTAIPMLPDSDRIG